MLNKFIAEGNLTRDPEVSKINDKYTVCKFGIAINNPYKENEPTYIDVEAWNKLADNCSKFLEKGRKVIVEGRLELKRWETKEQEKRTKLFCAAERVHFLSDSKETTPSVTEGVTEEAEEEDDVLEEIPF
tara:strand:- start:171 stop:560 length:390 start_codon:yes stop_codon:yes gene_type:complete